MEKIDALTPEQQAQLAVYRDKWIEIGLQTRTEPAGHRERVRDLIGQAYAQADLPPPKEIRYFPSPYAVKGELRRRGLATSGVCFGNQDAAWLAFYDYCLEVLGLAEVERLRPLIDLGQEIHWWWPFDAAVFVSEFPVAIRREGGRLHCTTRMSVEYPDGRGIYSLYGVTVPSWAVLTPPDYVDPGKVLGLRNTEQRTAIMRHVGLHRFLGALGAELLDEDVGYKLYYLNPLLPESGERVKTGPYLYMECPSTGRPFLEGVGDPEANELIDPTITTCKAAVQWRIRRASANMIEKMTQKPFQA